MASHTNPGRIHTERRWMRRLRDGAVFQYDALTMKEPGYKQVSYAEMMAAKPERAQYRPNPEMVGPVATTQAEISFARLPDTPDPLPGSDSDDDSAPMGATGPGDATALDGMTRVALQEYGRAVGVPLPDDLTRTGMIEALRQAGKVA